MLGYERMTDEQLNAYAFAILRKRFGNTILTKKRFQVLWDIMNFLAAMQGEV